MTLKNTVARMCSNHHSDRLIAEIQQAYIRMNELEDIIAIYSDDLGEAGRLYESLHATMRVYFHLLQARAELEHVDVELEV